MSQLEKAAREAIAALAECVYSDESSIFYAKGVAGKAILKLEAALAQQEKPEPVAVPPYLLNGTRFKVSWDSKHGAYIHGIPQELAGAWVAFVAADDDCHLKPPRREWVGLTDEQIRSIKESFCDEPIFPISLARKIEDKLKELNHGR